ncbi:MAG: hypothetical protein Q7R70_03550 [Candidatus Diapherotrites archaeon]|nr:hypothetical protein [Candidatus Diapherotrites archaeon]
MAKKHNALNKKSEFFSKSFWFALKFFIIFSVLYALLFILDFSPIENWLASLEAGFLGLNAVGNSVSINDFTYVISQSCIGLFSGIVLFAIIFACKKPGLKAKIAMAIAGAAALFLLNIPRVYLVLWAGQNFGPSAADLTHFASWFATTFFIIAVWYLLAEKIVGKEFKELI